jgi:hypothetical protein
LSNYLCTLLSLLKKVGYLLMYTITQNSWVNWVGYMSKYSITHPTHYPVNLRARLYGRVLKLFVIFWAPMFLLIAKLPVITYFSTSLRFLRLTQVIMRYIEVNYVRRPWLVNKYLKNFTSTFWMHKIIFYMLA